MSIYTRIVRRWTLTNPAIRSLTSPATRKLPSFIEVPEANHCRHILSKTGQTKRALYLIIENLSDVSFAISFAKEQDDPDLWNDLLDYSMDKPQFIRGLLAEVGTAIDPIQLVRRIPEGLEIEGLRDGIGRMVREYEIQHSISEGVAKVLRGEVAAGMDTLRAGQKRGVKFEVIPCNDTADTLQEKPPPRKELDIRPRGVDPKIAAKVLSSNTTTNISDNILHCS